MVCFIITVIKINGSLVDSTEFVVVTLYFACILSKVIYMYRLDSDAREGDTDKFILQILVDIPVSFEEFILIRIQE